MCRGVNQRKGNCPACRGRGVPFNLGLGERHWGGGGGGDLQSEVQFISRKSHNDWSTNRHAWLFVQYRHVSICEGDRLNDFRVMVGNTFIPNTTGISEISTWQQCVHVPGELCTWIVITFYFSWKLIWILPNMNRV